MMIGVNDTQSDLNACLAYRIRTTDPLSGTTTTAETLLPMYSGFTIPDPVKAENELTYTLPVSRKRSRDFYSVSTFSGEQRTDWNPIDRYATFTFLGDDVSSQIQQQQFEFDQFISRHSEKVRTEIDYRRRRNLMKQISALKLRSKEEEIIKMTKLNYALEDKVKSHCIENQIWREIAQTNEATANALRNNLKQILEQVVRNDVVVALADDAQSCCESNNGEERMLAEHDSGINMNRMCKSCGEAESCVVLLPCRHLCLCTVCVSCVDKCPVCKLEKNTCVHVHLS